MVYSLIDPKIGWILILSLNFSNSLLIEYKLYSLFSKRIISEILTSAPSTVEQAKLLCKSFDDWNGNMKELRDYTIKTTSVMRGGKEGQEGLGAFIERRKPNWHTNEE